MGIKRMLEDFGININLRINTDASAAKGITARRGAGKIRHIEVSQLWIQDRVRKGEIIMRKIDTKENLADALTKHVNQEALNYHISGTSQLVMNDRHNLAPESRQLNFVERLTRNSTTTKSAIRPTTKSAIRPTRNSAIKDKTIQNNCQHAALLRAALAIACTGMYSTFRRTCQRRSA